jgi:prepilin-type N-terminal cleavage/methylation domain-containing protein
MRMPRQNVRPTGRRAAHSRAMTLVEVLVVTAIIVILYSISAPLGPEALRRARMGSCTSNIRQMLAAIDMYYQDWGGYPGTWAWRPLYPSYVPNYRVLVCPNDETPPAAPTGELVDSSYTLQARSQGPELAEAMRRRGPDFPAVVCRHHVLKYPSSSSFVLVGRLNGQVEWIRKSSLDAAHVGSSWDY